MWFKTTLVMIMNPWRVERGDVTEVWAFEDNKGSAETMEYHLNYGNQFKLYNYGTV